MTDNHQRAGNVLAEVEQHVLVRQRQRILAAALDAAEARGRAERDEQTGIVVAALVARAELAEAEIRQLETLARIDHGITS